MTAIVIRGGRSAKASRDLRWTTESRALGDASGFGQNRPLEIRPGFASLDRLGCPVYGGQLEPRLGSTRPYPAGHHLHLPAIRAATSRKNLPDGLREQFGLSGPSGRILIASVTFHRQVLNLHSVPIFVF